VAARLEAQVEAVAADLPELAGYRPAVERALVGIGQGPIAVQRLHGDFHLGQTLISPAGWTILDFEGEPLKTPAQRREMDSRWRDVAGLVRSIDYARSSHPDPASPAATAWAEQSRAAFLAAYDPDQFGPPGNPVPAGLQALTSSLPAPLAERPPAPGSPPRLLAAYEAAKACYELLYEARNRPAWLPIPLGALKRL
jgi:maltokinase